MCRKAACDSGCFLGFGCFSGSVRLCDKRFSSQAIHGSMLSLTGCGCEGMLEKPKKSHYLQNRFCCSATDPILL